MCILKLNGILNSISDFNPERRIREDFPIQFTIICNLQNQVYLRNKRMQTACGIDNMDYLQHTLWNTNQD